MIKPELDGIFIFSENWGNDIDDFWVVVQANIGPNNGKGLEIFTFNVTSPKSLERVVEEGAIEIGRGLLITNDFNIKNVENTIRHLVENCQGETWDDVALSLCRYAYWEFEDYTESNI